MKLDKWIESVPNFSEGRDLKKVERIVDSFRAKPGVKLLDYSTDPDHNRCVVTVLGQPEPLKRAMVEAIGTAVELIDMTRHEGQHPRIGCVDVIPFIPVRDCTIQEADQLAREIAQEAALLYGQPFYLYEKSATAPHRVDLANIRKGQFEGLAEKMKDPLWKPDFGPDTIHPTGGATAIGARMPLICFNINLDASDLLQHQPGHPQCGDRPADRPPGAEHRRRPALCEGHGHRPGGAEPGSGDHEPDRLHQKFHLQCL